MLPDRVSNPGPLTYESGALPIALRGPAVFAEDYLQKHTLTLLHTDRPKLYTILAFLSVIGLNQFHSREYKTLQIKLRQFSAYYCHNSNVIYVLVTFFWL